MIKLLSFTLITVLTVDLLATSGDITMTWSSPMVTKLKSNDSKVNPFENPINDDEESWIGSLINIGAMIGPFPYGFLSAKYGRKITLLSIAIPHIISYLIFAFSKTIYLYYFARILGGLAVGGGYTLLPTYVAEVSEDSNRGMFSSTLNIFWTFGNLIPYVIGPYTPVLWFNIILACVPTTFFVLFFVIAPESPYYLTMNGKISEAEKVLMKLRSNDKKAIEDEIKNIQNELTQNSDQITFTEFLRSKTYVKGLIISMILIAAQQLSGINAVLFYTEDIFKGAGATNIEPEISAMIIGFVIFFSSFGTPFVVDRLGRRMLLLISLLGMTFAHICLGVYFYLQDSTDVDLSSITWLPIVSLVVYLITFNTGIGPLPWTVSSEMFPTNVKSYTASIVSCTCWTTSFIVTKFFNSLETGLGVGPTFWLFAGFCFCTWIFTLFVVPETKGKSFQEIQEILKG